MSTRRALWRALLPAALGVVGLVAPGGTEGVTPKQGAWVELHDARHTVKQSAEEGTGLALMEGLSGALGAWRCTVEPALGAQEAGLWFQRDPAGHGGFLCALSGGSQGGLVLRDASGKTLWADEGAVWKAYEPYVLEGVVEKGRVRAQLLRWDGRTLLSQSPWIDVSETGTAPPGCLGFHTLKAVARFWGAQRAEKTLCEVTEDAPNRRRLVQGKDSEWLTVGPGNWMWTDGKRQWVRQYASVDRAWAINRALRGSRGTWECGVRVFPGAGGAGMAILTNEERKQGFICWLGGTFGAGCLMLYPLPGEALWASAEGQWHYDTEYVIRAVVEEKSVRLQLLAADGRTIVESPPVAVSPEATAREGWLGLHTWIGTAEFGGFRAP